MRTDELSYDLPDRLIAQEPPAERDGARLLVLEQRYGTTAHRTIRDLPDLLGPADLLVVNDARVLPARLDTRRATGGAVEVLMLEPVGPDGLWRALVRAGGLLRVGETLHVGDGDGLKLHKDEGEGRWIVHPEGRRPFEVMARHGRMPLPPYIRRSAGDRFDALDRERYQTVYAQAAGAVAAPTAGLHLTPEIFDELDARMVERCAVTLLVGLGTFEPVRVKTLEDHRMHAERFVIPPETAARIRAAKARGKRVVAVGTTTVRALEGAAITSRDGLPAAGQGTTDLFIAPGHRFRVVDGLLTNFHLPRSTLLALVGALGGLNRVLAAYREAIREEYRFYSYGDAMLIL